MSDAELHGHLIALLKTVNLDVSFQCIYSPPFTVQAAHSISPCMRRASHTEGSLFPQELLRLLHLHLGMDREEDPEGIRKAA